MRKGVKSYFNYSSSLEDEHLSHQTQDPRNHLSHLGKEELVTVTSPLILSVNRIFVLVEPSLPFSSSSSLSPLLWLNPISRIWRFGGGLRVPTGPLRHLTTNSNPFFLVLFYFFVFELVQSEYLKTKLEPAHAGRRIKLAAGKSLRFSEPFLGLPQASNFVQ